MFKFQSSLFSGTGSRRLITSVIFLFLLFGYYFDKNYKPLLKPNQDLNQERIRKRIKKVCQRTKFNSTVQLLYDGFMVDPIHKVSYCRQGKVGTTTWMRHFSKLLSDQDRLAHDYESMNSSQLHRYITWHFKHRPKSGIDLNQTFKFSFVRHPYDRLVSAYEDKVHGRKPFEFFLLDILHQYRHKKQMNHHFNPYNQRCQYCQVTYDYIGRMETFAQDVEEILKRANLTLFIPLKDASLRKHSSKMLDESQSRGLDSHGAIKSSATAQRYFVNVSSRIMHQLHQIYSLDFAMFHYSYEGFLTTDSGNSVNA